jgi:hypothetical protein
MIDFEKVTFGQNLPTEGWKLARVKNFDDWESKKDATKKGIKAVLRLVTDSYGKDIALLDDEMLTPGGPISKLIEAARGDKAIDYNNEKPPRLMFDTVGQQVYVLIKHKKVDDKIFPKIVQIASIKGFHNDVNPPTVSAEPITEGKSKEDANGWDEIPRT